MSFERIVPYICTVSPPTIVKILCFQLKIKLWTWMKREAMRDWGAVRYGKHSLMQLLHITCHSLLFFSSLRYWTGSFAGRLKSNENLWVHYRLHIYSRVGSFTSPGIDTRQKGPPAFSVSSERHRQMWGEWNSLSLKMAVGGMEPPSPRLTVRHSIAWPPLST